MFYLCAAHQALAQTPKSKYPAMEPVDRYLIPDQQAEIALARSAAPASISSRAEIMVLEKNGYSTAVKGSNGFLCLVERSWGAGTEDADFWNPKVRSPVCFNSAAAKTYVPRYAMKTRLLLAGRSKQETVKTIMAALDSSQLPALESGAMCYMMSKQQYLNDPGKAWHPHLMFFVSGDAAKDWGADFPGSPIMAAKDPEEKLTILMVWVSHWSDGTSGPPMTD